jgi:hypothetical protein
VVGTIWKACTCDRPPFARSVVWTSPDGRTWTLHDKIATFAGASLRGVVTDGTRLVAFGYAMPSTGNGAARVPAAWSSANGSAWTRSPDPAPSIVAVGPHGFVGAIPANYYSSASAGVGSVRFVASADGLAWRSTSRTFDAYLGDESEASSLLGDQVLAASPSGGVMAVGSVPVDPHPTSAVVWRSADGTTWSGPLRLAQVATPKAIAASGDAFLVAGPAAMSSDGASHDEIWRLAGDTLPSSPVFTAGDGEAITQVFGVGNLVIAVGFDGTGGSRAWVSTDGGTSFGRSEGEAPFNAGPTTMVTALLQSTDGLMAVVVGVDGQPEVQIGR